MSSQAGQLEAWQSQLAEQQARLEELEATAAEAVAEARDAAVAALQDRDQVGDVARGGLTVQCSAGGKVPSSALASQAKGF